MCKCLVFFTAVVKYLLKAVRNFRKSLGLFLSTTMCLYFTTAKIFYSMGKIYRTKHVRSIKEDVRAKTIS